jgi:hypothetical protein
MSRYRRFQIVGRIQVNRMSTSFAVKPAAITVKVVEQGMPFHDLVEPTSTVKGINSTRSASGHEDSELGFGSARPSSK